MKSRSTRQAERFQKKVEKEMNERSMREHGVPDKEWRWRQFKIEKELEIRSRALLPTREEHFEKHPLNHFPEGLTKEMMKEKAVYYEKQQRKHGKKIENKLKYATSKKTPDFLIYPIGFFLLLFFATSCAAKVWQFNLLAVPGGIFAFQLIISLIVLPLHRKHILLKWGHCYDKKLAKEYEDLCSKFQDRIVERAFKVLNVQQAEPYKYFFPIKFWGYKPDNRWWEPQYADLHPLYKRASDIYKQKVEGYTEYYQTSIVQCGVLLCYNEKVYIYEEVYNFLTGENYWLLNEHSCYLVKKLEYRKPKYQVPQFVFEFTIEHGQIADLEENDDKIFYLTDASQFEEWFHEYNKIQPQFRFHHAKIWHMFYSYKEYKNREDDPLYQEAKKEYDNMTFKWE